MRARRHTAVRSGIRPALRSQGDHKPGQTQVWTVEGGKIMRGEEYFDRAEALEAAGLSE